MTTRILVGVMAAAAAACQGPTAFTERLEARRLVAEMQVQFARAADAANRAVMADTDELSLAASREAGQGTSAVGRGVEQLRPLLTSLKDSEGRRLLAAFDDRFAEYLELDAEILPLAAENTNLKAQRLSFGPAREAANAFRSSVAAAAGIASPAYKCRAEALAARAVAMVLEVQVLQAPHIAEAEDHAMTGLEEQMATLEATAREALEQMTPLLPSEARRDLGATTAALERFITINREIVGLSRRNSDVRSLALTLGRKRAVTAQCYDQLRALQDAVAKYDLTGTR